MDQEKRIYSREQEQEYSTAAEEKMSRAINLEQK
jgi:hypothetical protein